MSHTEDVQAEEFLDTLKVKNICTSRNVVTIGAQDTIERAMEILAERGITGAPVWDHEKKQFVGFVDTLDLTMFVAYLYYENYQKHPHLYDPKELKKRFSLPISDVVNASRRDPFWTIDSEESVGFLINNFLKAGLHRVPVMENGNVVGIVSQSDVVRALFKYKDKISRTVSKKISELNYEKCPVVSVKNDAKLIDAFNIILANDVTGVAVVDFRTGKLLNNLSANDLKGIREGNFFKLEAQVHQIFSNSTEKKPVVSCSPNNTLWDVINQIENTGVHRVYVVDEEERPKGVISLTDIMRYFSRPSNPLDL